MQDMTLKEAETLALSTLKAVMEEKVRGCFMPVVQLMVFLAHTIVSLIPNLCERTPCFDLFACKNS